MRGSLPVSSLSSSNTKSNYWFVRFAATTAHWAGTSSVFVIAVLIVVIWAIVGPLFNYSDSWQLVINTGTTIVTFLMVFLIQNTQNREAKATQLKLDELIRAVRGARDALVDVEEGPDEELLRLQQEFRTLRRRALLDQVRERGMTRVMVAREADLVAGEDQDLRLLKRSE